MLIIDWRRPVVAIAERCEELAKLSNELPAVIRPAFMAEVILHGPSKIDRKIQEACTSLKVLRFYRGDRNKFLDESCAGPARNMFRF